jgi:steroid 5-alpha reductase family enzyme
MLTCQLLNIRSSPQIWWANAECSSEFPVSAGAFVSGFNSLYTVINSLVFVYRVSRGKTNPLASNWMQYLGFLAVVVGNVGEIVIESSRRAFKNDKRNAGKVYDQGALRGQWPCY